MSTPNNADLRTLVRELIRDVLPQIAVPEPARTVRITSDEELASFVQQVVALLDDSVSGPRLRAGQLMFRLDGKSGDGRTPAPADDGRPVIEVERGAVTEKIVARAASEGARIVMSRRAVVTPLAREQARRAGVELERTS